MPNLVSVTVVANNLEFGYGASALTFGGTITSPFILTGAYGGTPPLNTQQFAATAHFDDLSTQDVTGNLNTAWDLGITMVTSNAVASINTTGSGGNKGLATANTISGSTVIRASYTSGGITQSGTALLRVGLAGYKQIIEPSVDAIKNGTAFNETAINSLHNPIIKLTTPKVSMLAGGATFINTGGFEAAIPIGYAAASGHPGDYARLYIANEVQQIGNLVQLLPNGRATIVLSGAQKNLGIVVSSATGVGLAGTIAAGDPVLVQIAGEAYVLTNGTAIGIGFFVEAATGSTNGTVRQSAATIGSPTPIVGVALENAGNTFQNTVLIRIQILG